MANIISKFFRAEIDRQLMSMSNSQVNQATSLYNFNTFRFLGYDMPVSMPDDPNTYVTDGYLNMAAVNRCVNLLLTKVASVPIITYENKEGSNNQKFREFKALNSSTEIYSKVRAEIIRIKELKEVNNSEIMKLIETPNEFQTWDEWMKYFVGSYLLTGNAYDYLNGPFLEDYNPKTDKFTEHFVLPTGQIEIISGGPNMPVKAYRMRNQASYTDYPENQVIHWKTFNPEYCSTGSQLYGISPLRAYLEPLLRNKIGDKELSRQLKNGGSFGFISPKRQEDVLSSDQKKGLKDQLVLAKKSDDEISRIFPSSIPLDWTQVGLKPDDLQLLKIKSIDEESIYKAFNVPLVFANQDSASYNNISEAKKQFVYNAIAPICEDIGTQLTRKICGPIEKRTGKKYQIYLDYNALPEMQADMAKVSEWISKSDELTRNEKREAKGYGRLEIEGMDSIFISGNERLIQDAAISDSDFDRAANELNV